jgi:hypothetical protein
MTRYYVDVTNIPDDLLEIMGYCLFEETEEFQLRVFKGDAYILRKEGKKFLYVEDANDAAIFRARAKIQAPPKPAVKKSPSRRK